MVIEEILAWRLLGLSPIASSSPEPRKVGPSRHLHDSVSSTCSSTEKFGIARTKKLATSSKLGRQTCHS
jgi:hypothetical protein